MLILGSVVAIAIGTAFFFQSSSLEKHGLPEGNNTKPAPTGNSTGLMVGSNAIYVAEQAPARAVSIAVVQFEKPGFVVIHEDSADKPGNILGTSGILPAGETKNLAPITLSRTTKDGETLYAMLHFDDGNGVFDLAKDKPALDSVGNEPVMMIFTISADASVPDAVNPVRENLHEKQ